MDANNFYKMWDDSINATNVANSMENLDMFDDLDLLEDDCDTIIIDSTAQPTEIAVPITNTFAIKNVNFEKAQKNIEVKSQIAPLKQAILTFCEQYDYKDLQDYVKGTDATKESLILEWLHRIYNIVIDSDYDDVLLNYSADDLKQVCCKYRNMNLSELLIIAPHLHKNYFDKSIIRDYSLEMRDTGLLLELMQNNNFNREEALLYSNNLETYNSYLLLKTSGKFEATVFETVKGSDENLNSYAKSVLSNNPWAFLGSHKDFSKIIKLVQTNEIPIELAEHHRNINFLYEILVAYSKGLYSSAFIDNYLNTTNLFCDRMAQLYCEGSLDAQTLNSTNGNFYLSKLIYDATAFTINKDLRDMLYDNGIMDKLYYFSKSIIDNVFEGNLADNEWYKFVYYLNNNCNVTICEDYLRLSQIHGSITFNQFWYLKLIEVLNIPAKIPASVGELVMYQNGSTVSYFNVQMVWESFDILIESILDKLSTNIAVKLLPEQKGIIICQKDYNSFSEERIKFQKLSNCKSSVSFAIEDNKRKDIGRYNITKMSELASQTYSGATSDSFNCLSMITPEKYLVYDNLINLICSKYSEFAGLCMCSESIQCLKLFNNMLKLPTHAEVQIGFIKAFLEFKFKHRIRFESINASMLQEIKFIEVKNSYSYGDCSFAKVICTLDNFINELNKKNTIICKFDGVSKMIFEGA